MVANQHEAGGHQDGVGGEGVAHEAARPAPEAHQDQDGGKREKLSDLDANVECDEVRKKAVRRNLELDDLGGEPEAVEEAEHQRRRLSVRLNAEPALECAQVVQRLVNHRQADDRVDDIGVRAYPGQHPEQHRCRVSDREQRDVDGDVLHPVKEEDHAEQEQQMVVARDHVLGPEIEEREEQDAAAFLDVAFVALGDVVGEGVNAETEREREQAESQEQPVSRAALHGSKQTHHETPFRSPARRGGAREWTDSGFRQSRVGGLIALSAGGTAVDDPVECWQDEQRQHCR